MSADMTTLTEKQFRNCISILLRNYHAVNRKVFGCVICDVHKVVEGIECIDRKWHSPQEMQNVAFSHASAEAEMQEALMHAVERDNKQVQGFLIHHKFLTKKVEEQSIEALGILDFTTAAYSCHFRSDTGSLDDFVVRFCQDELIVEILTQRVDVDISTRWANNVLRPKLLNWMHSEIAAVENAGKGQVKSLQLVDIELYNDLYKQLKSKHASNVLKYWTAANESTDPLKFIYEDLAIAAYLITLWRYRSECKLTHVPTAFADLGCGNGLLVYILNEEGYKGYGYDVRARKLWSHYPPATQHQLIEQAIEPTNFKLPAEVDWLIGNHSDELSPWLPVLAATARFEMSYFLLPCCAYEFSGAKFQRRNSNISGYQDFYAYAKCVSEKCGYKTLEDRLKIPSTKRLALIGIERTNTEATYESKRKEINCFVKQEINEHGNATPESEVKLRVKEESVRNCTQIDRSVIDALVQKIFQLLLLTSNDVEKQQLQSWRTGGRLSMRDIVNSLTKDDLRHIKSECGGIKTLLRNKHEIFEFCGNDLIGIRKPQARDIISQQPKTNSKKRYCFFKQYHPSGCPLKDELCTFLH